MSSWNNTCKPECGSKIRERQKCRKSPGLVDAWNWQDVRQPTVPLPSLNVISQITLTGQLGCELRGTDNCYLLTPNYQCLLALDLNRVDRSLITRRMLAMRRACYTLLLVYLFCQLHSLNGGLRQKSFLTAKSKNSERKSLRRIRPLGSSNLHKITLLRGGSNIAASDESIKVVPSEVCVVVVSTSVGSIFLDKKKRLSVSRNATVAELKCMIEKKFPGCPPTGLQKLFLGVRALADDELIGNITVASPTPILLDMLSGTSVYNKTLSISQALEAHAALIVQQSYLGAKMRATYSDIDLYGAASAVADANGTAIQPQLESGLYRDMFDAVNRTLYETYAEDIAEALEREKEPETVTDDTAAWRGKQKETKPLTAALAKEFDLNMRGIKSFFYYSILLGVSKIDDFVK